MPIHGLIWPEFTAMNKNLEMALKYLEKSLQKGFRNLDKIESEIMLDSIRSEKKYEQLILKYFQN